MEAFPYASLKYVLLDFSLLDFHWLQLSWLKKIALSLQFSNHGSLESHGFARNRIWSIDIDPPPFPTQPSSKAFIDLILKPSEEDLKIWPNRYSLERFFLMNLSEKDAPLVFLFILSLFIHDQHSFLIFLLFSSHNFLVRF